MYEHLRTESETTQMSLNDDEKKQLTDYSLMDALSKVELMAHVRSTLYDLESRVRRYQEYGNSRRDPEIAILRVKISNLATSVPNSGEHFLRALGTDVEDYMYDRPGEDIDLLLKEAGLGSMDEVEDDGSFWEESLPFEDPLEVYKRNK